LIWRFIEVRTFVRWLAAGSIGLAFAATGITRAQEPADKWPHVQPADKWPKVKPADQWQVPGEIQKPGDIQVPGDIQGVKVKKEKCEQRLIVAADSLFEFDKDVLTPSAAASLEKLGPGIKVAATYGARIEGHTDGKGGDDYNQKLSERRAKAVRSWLSTRQFLPASTMVTGFGKRKPVAPNTNPDGSDNPDGRALNRRVELIFLTCK
jgi:outer membrane protein OmpA-like peptidoglycan-associated protein